MLQKSHVQMGLKVWELVGVLLKVKRSQQLMSVYCNYVPVVFKATLYDILDEECLVCLKPRYLHGISWYPLSRAKKKFKNFLMGILNASKRPTFWNTLCVTCNKSRKVSCTDIVTFWIEALGLYYIKGTFSGLNFGEVSSLKGLIIGEYFLSYY